MRQDIERMKRDEDSTVKRIRLVGTGVLLLLGLITPAFAQQDQHGQDGKAQKQEQPQQHAQQQAQPQGQAKQPQQQAQPQGQAKQPQQQAQPQGQAKQPQQHAQQQAQPQGQAKQPQQHAQQQAQPQGQAKQPQQHAQQQAQPQGQAKQPQQHAQQQAQPQGQAKQPQQHAQQQTQPQQQNKQPQQHAQQQAPAGHPSQQGQRVQRGDEQAVWQQHRSTNWQSEHRTWQQRGGYNGYRIPDDHFRGYFGPSHGFRLFSLNLVIFGGYPAFQYGGYWITLLDPWPDYWGPTWYQNDDVYIDYSGDGYYLYNRRYPGDRIAIEVYLN